MQLTSTKNPRLQAIRRAAASGRPAEDGLIVIEGPHLVREAVRSAWELVEIFATSDSWERHRPFVGNANVPLRELSSKAMASIASTETTQGLLALVRPRKWSWDDLFGKRPLILVLDGIQDPGNAGTMVRSAEAFGASGLVFLRQSVRVSNGKFVRATAGSIFRVPFLENVDSADLLRHSGRRSLPIYALAAGGETDLQDISFPDGCALIVGNEGGGVSPGLLSRSRQIRIPTCRVESLNAAVACSIALYALNQRRGGT